MEIRRYHISDQSAVWRLHEEGLNEAGVNLGDGPWDDDLREIGSTYLSGRGEFFVGISQGHVVAMGAIRLASPECAEIKRIRVDRQFRRRGWADSLLSALEDRARHLGFSRISLDTTSHQEAAQRLFIKHGYREASRRQGDGFEEILFEKALDEVP